MYKVDAANRLDFWVAVVRHVGTVLGLLGLAAVLVFLLQDGPDVALFELAIYSFILIVLSRTLAAFLEGFSLMVDTAAKSRRDQERLIKITEEIRDFNRTDAQAAFIAQAQGGVPRRMDL